MFPKEPRGNSLILELSLFIGWFNPLQNKLSGRQTSMGVIALNCLNLPPHLRYQPNFTYLYGIIPGPNQPNIFKISSILGPLFNELLESNRGITICTPKYPQECKVIVKLAASIGDVFATHKVEGFMSHSANRFCTWFDIKINQKQELKLGRCQYGRDVCHTSFDYCQLESCTKKEKLAKKTGIHWSELNFLPYWNPLLNVTLGVMHNWFEGVLQHHFNYQWGFSGNSARQNDSSVSNSNSDSEEIINLKMSFFPIPTRRG
ncbi:hypothetical protein O181_054283 [Austropuccinia psidii MF-1]|uniref:Uncharacterized protein n=1 Tax=Austropuccinia psidii MF-1 TaxID=1389203 RepID=A0A9Q3HR94_9BASI|nr:hypothetical protein [Austropuccinia psidii MF-1]